MATPESRVDPVLRVPPSTRTETGAGSLARTRYEWVIRHNPLVASLGEAATRDLVRCASARHFKKGESIWRAGNPATHFQIVVSGIVKLVGVHAGLRPMLIDAYGPGESLGYWAALDGSHYIGDAIPITQHVETLFIPASALVRIVETQPGAALAMVHNMLGHAQSLRRKIAVMCAGTVGQRLATLLLDLRVRFGDEAEDGSTILPVPLSRQDLALGVGATIETVIRIMSRWQKEGVLATHDRGFVLYDVAVLEALLTGAPELARVEEHASA